MPIHRRSLMTGAALAVGAGILGTAGVTVPAPAAAGTPARPGSPPAAYRYKVGDATVTALSDGAFVRKLEDGFVKNAALADVQKALADAHLPTDTLQISFTTLVVETGGKRVLIDAGFADNGPPTAGRMFAALELAGIAPDSIDTVLVSHFHPDHIHGLRLKDGTATFPNAEIAVPAAEWDFWMDDARMAQAPDAMKGNFQNVRRVFGPNAADVRRFAWGAEAAPGIVAVDAAGHTPGHTAFAITAGGGRLLVLSDTTNAPYLFVRNPDWQVAFDMDGEKARATRHRLLDMAAAESMQVAGYHFPFPATGHIARDGKGYALDPAVWLPVQ